ncbi:hypothetical protein [Methanohalobium sp.]|uniref:hypothetical protein n=1 Tax=Methanohalobium sp. TaxID=2837493 RepID=UPI0025E2D5B9|nr:hypothetical protein [Methanohalobium sp.]
MVHIVNKHNSNHGQTVVIGVVLLVAILVIAAGFYVEDSKIQAENEEFAHYDDFELSMLDLDAKTNLVTTTNVSQQTTFNSKIQYPFILQAQLNNYGYKVTNSNKTASLTYENNSGMQSYTYTTNSIKIIKKYNYADTMRYTYVHSMLYQNKSNTQPQIKSINIIDDEVILLQNTDADININQQQRYVFNIRGESTKQQQKTIQNGSIKIETDANLSEFNTIEQEPNVISLTRDGDSIVISLKDGEYTVIKQNNTITTR